MGLVTEVPAEAIPTEVGVAGTGGGGGMEVREGLEPCGRRPLAN